MTEQQTLAMAAGVETHASGRGGRSFWWRWKLWFCSGSCAPRSSRTIPELEFESVGTDPDSAPGPHRLPILNHFARRLFSVCHFVSPVSSEPLIGGSAYQGNAPFVDLGIQAHKLLLVEDEIIPNASGTEGRNTALTCFDCTRLENPTPRCRRSTSSFAKHRTNQPSAT
jgi:hypothetical protein